MPELLGFVTPEGMEALAVIGGILDRYEPWCATHRGKMRCTYPDREYRCAGFDGEGCPVTVNTQDVWGWIFPPPEVFEEMMRQWQPSYPQLYWQPR